MFVGGVGGLLEGTEWVMVLLWHAFFVGMMTNLLFGVLDAASAGLPSLHEYEAPAAMWLMNFGILVFYASEILVGSPHGPAAMGAGVLLGVATFTYRLWSAKEERSDRDRAAASPA